MSKRCMGCMEKYSDGFVVCPHCGYVEGTQAESAVHLPPNTLLHNRYIIGKVLGSGGFGVTYIGWDLQLEQKVAIKEYLPSEFSTRMLGETAVTVFNGEKSEQFQDGLNKSIDEARRLAKFQNEPGIVKIFDSFAENGTAYIIMEFLDGETLRAYLNRVTRIPEDEAVGMIWPALESLQVVHSKGIIHRDIAPDNIFLTKNGEVKLIDFGASRFATTSHSRSLTVIIKRGYSPEEQYRSRGDQGPHTDVYAMGAVLYKMITGQTPPDALERRAKLETLKKDILEPPHKFVKDLSEIRENAILNAMNVRIEDRTPDIATFMRELYAEKPAKRKSGTIKKIDLYKWPLWLKIVIPCILALIAAFGVLLATGVISFRSLFSSVVVVPEKMVAVPDIELMDKDEAIKTLEDLKIMPATSGNVESGYIEAGRVVLQSPNAGSYVYEYGTVFLTISSGIGVIAAEDGVATVPYVIWDTLEDAVDKLISAGFAEPEIIEQHDNNVEAGRVISQSVDYGTKMEEGEQITLIVSLGPETFLMVNTRNMTEETAIQLLEGLGMIVQIERASSNEIEEGHVVSQSIVPGTETRPGSSIVLVISTGRQETETTSGASRQETTTTSTASQQETTTTSTTSQQETTTHVHSYSSRVTQEASCGKDGVRTYTCSCGDTYTERIAATGDHKYISEVTVQPGVGVQGTRKYTCTVCGNSYTETIPAWTVSDWVLAGDVPSGAEIYDTKWTYTKTSYTQSTNSSMPGWTQYDSSTTWSSYGSWSGWQDAYVSSSQSRQVETQSVPASYQMISYCMTDYNSPSLRSYYSYNPGGILRLLHENTWTADEFNNSTRVPEGSYYNTFNNVAGYIRGSGDAYYRSNGSLDDYVPQYISSISYKTQYRYRDRTQVTTYYYSKTEYLEDYYDPTGESGVSDVKKYVKYIVK